MNLILIILDEKLDKKLKNLMILHIKLHKMYLWANFSEGDHVNKTRTLKEYIIFA